MIHPTLPPILRAGLMVATLAIGSAATAQQTPADREDAALAHAQCMRDNGFAEFPDPTPDGRMQLRVDAESASRFQAASAACRHLAPEGLRDEGTTPETLEALLKLSQCIRQNGVPDFPDPNADGSFDLRGVSKGPDDPRIAAAMDACSDLRQGLRIMIGG